MRNIRNQPDVIFEIQRYLRALHFDSDGKIPLLNPDGIYGPETRAAVEAYQRMAGLPVTGQTDLATWKRLYADYTEAGKRAAPPKALAPFPADAGYEIRPGEYSDITAIVQFVLRLLADHYEELSGPALTGIYDEATSADVARFQKRHSLSQTGLVDKATWNELADAYNRLHHAPD